ncbi:MAG: transposase [Micromonosporaceae bacterium]|nr:transposase [Micromonosporaceae bacterium]
MSRPRARCDALAAQAGSAGRRACRHRSEAGDEAAFLGWGVGVAEPSGPRGGPHDHLPHRHRGHPGTLDGHLHHRRQRPRRRPGRLPHRTDRDRAPRRDPRHQPPGRPDHPRRGRSGHDTVPHRHHLASWAKLTPRTIQSGARHRPGKTGKGNPYLNGLLGEAATAAARTNTFLGERYRRDAVASTESPAWGIPNEHAQDGIPGRSRRARETGTELQQRPGCLVEGFVTLV